MSDAAQPSSGKHSVRVRVSWAVVIVALVCLVWLVRRSDLLSEHDGAIASSGSRSTNGSEAQGQPPERGRAEVVRSPAVLGPTAVGGQVLIDGGEPAVRIPVAWQIVSVRETMPLAFQGETVTDTDGRFAIEVPGRASVELRAMLPDLSYRCLPRIVPAGATVTLYAMKTEAVGFELVDAATGNPISISQSAVTLDVSDFVAEVAMPADMVLPDHVPRLLDAMGAGRVRVFQRTLKDGPAEISAQVTPGGYQPLRWSFQLRSPAAALLNPEVVAVEPVPGTVSVRLRFESADGRKVQGAHYVALRRVGDGAADVVFRGFEVSDVLHTRLGVGRYQCGATVISSSAMEMQPLQVMEGAVEQEFRIVLAPSATVCFRSSGQASHAVPIVIQSLVGVDGAAVGIDLNSVWPDRRVDEIVLRGLPPGRYKACWYVGPKRYEEEFGVAGADIREIVRAAY